MNLKILNFNSNYLFLGPAQRRRPMSTRTGATARSLWPSSSAGSLRILGTISKWSGSEVFFDVIFLGFIDDVRYKRRIYFKAYKAQVILSFVMDITRSTWLFPISYNTICCEYCIIWLSLRDSLDIFENCSIFGVLQFSANEVIISLIKAASY